MRLLRRARAPLVLLLAAGMSLQAQAPSQSLIGGFDFFGYGGLNIASLRAALGPFIGRTITDATRLAMREEIGGVVKAITGRSPTNVAFVCCGSHGETQAFVGLHGSTSHALRYAAPPVGRHKLPGSGLALYLSDMKALEAAVRSGHAEENDSQGYALAEEPQARSVQLAMRRYALENTLDILEVLRSSSSPDERRAAAELLGYAEHGPITTHALSDALLDSDNEVRNNAARALGVMGRKGSLPGLDVRPVIAMLYSGTWTDRNKASFLLMGLTSSKDLVLLAKLRRSAMPALLEGAGWEPSHAAPFQVLLDRVAAKKDRAK